MRNLIRALRGKPVELSEKQQAKMAKMQARADAMIAEQNAKGRAAMEEAAAFQATQGVSVGGPAPAAPSFDPSQPLPPVRELFKQAVESRARLVRRDVRRPQRDHRPRAGGGHESSRRRSWRTPRSASSGRPTSGPRARRRARRTGPPRRP